MCLIYFNDITNSFGLFYGLFNTGNMFYMSCVLLVNIRFILLIKKTNFITYISIYGSIILYFIFWYYLSNSRKIYNDLENTLPELFSSLRIYIYLICFTLFIFIDHVIYKTINKYIIKKKLLRIK